jgi:hypothetical protein
MLYTSVQFSVQRLQGKLSEIRSVVGGIVLSTLYLLSTPMPWGGGWLHVTARAGVPSRLSMSPCECDWPVCAVLVVWIYYRERNRKSCPIEKILQNSSDACRNVGAVVQLRTSGKHNQVKHKNRPESFLRQLGSQQCETGSLKGDLEGANLSVFLNTPYCFVSVFIVTLPQERLKKTKTCKTLCLAQSRRDGEY